MTNRINLKIVLLIALSSSFSSAWQVGSGDLQKWIPKTNAKQSVYTEMQKYFSDHGGLNPADKDYTKQFVTRTHLGLLKSAQLANQKYDAANAACSSSSLIDFPGSITGLNAGSGFEKDVMRIQTIDCLGAVNLDKVFTLMMSSDFQKQAISAIKRITVNETTNQICHDTYVFLLGSSSYCFTQNIWHDQNTYFIQSFNELNRGVQDVPVYFREVVTVIKKLKSGQVVIYNVSYGRGPNLPLQEAAKVYVSSQQQTVMNLLRSKLR